jgi:1-phosphatidylinositol-4-phosphate 5-kinase
MSVEESIRQAQERDQAQAAAAAASEEMEQVGPDGSPVNAATAHPIPQSLSSSALPSGQKSPEADATMKRAMHEASKTELRGSHEENIPDRTLKTTAGPSSSKTMPASGAGRSERHESTVSITQAAILPVVEEATEGLSTAEHSRNSHVSSTLTAESDGRPLTPAKDGEEREAGFSNPLLGSYRKLSTGRGPPTPPKTGNGQGTSLKPHSADSGYGVTGGSANGHALKGSTGSQGSLNIRNQLSRDSLDKALPPLPRGDAWPQEAS